MKILKYPETLEKLKLGKYDVVIVSGPQRSGTRFTAKAMAYDLNKEYVDENDFGVHKIENFYNLLSTKNNFVVHCPDITQHLHTLSHPNAVVIFSYRDTDDIIKSQDRINWTNEFDPQLREIYKKVFNTDPKINWDAPISYIKYEVWEKLQIPNMEIPHINNWYESLKSHPLWIEKENRKNFGALQTK